MQWNDKTWGSSRTCSRSYSVIVITYEDHFKDLNHCAMLLLTRHHIIKKKKTCRSKINSNFGGKTFFVCMLTRHKKNLRGNWHYFKKRLKITAAFSYYYAGIEYRIKDSLLFLYVVTCGGKVASLVTWYCPKHHLLWFLTLYDKEKKKKRSTFHVHFILLYFANVFYGGVYELFRFITPLKINSPPSIIPVVTSNLINHRHDLNLKKNPGIQLPYYNQLS